MSEYKSTYKPFSVEVQDRVWSITNGLCWYCGVQTSKDKTAYQRGVSIKNKFTIDHIVSLRYGGAEELDNFVPACWSCNTSKNKRSIVEWRDSLRWKDIGRFTDKQIAWLLSNGIEMPEPPEVKFYFETMGLG